jgi:aspartyl-tRNA(Asn)/glutamyl-tRNA(Gln) amidotransferase subunit A
MKLSSLTLARARDLVSRKEIEILELAEACHREIERLNPALNAFITILPPELPVPAASDPQLHGLPIGVKDLYETKGIRTTAGTKFFADYIPTEDSFVVQKIKDAGGIVIGKTNTHEIAFGVTNVNPHYGACRNPWDRARITGGSSGGSAAAVAADMCIAAVGTDTGGSIRIPASLCGVVGLKPTYGRVSLRGIFPLSWTLDHAGPLAKTVEDAACMLQVIAGYDPLDPTSIDEPAGDFFKHALDGMSGRKIALATGSYLEKCDPEVLSALRDAAHVFETMGAHIEEVDVAWMRDAALTNTLIVSVDGAAYHRERLKEHPDWFGVDVRQRLEKGPAYTSSEYALARRAQVEARRIYDLLFEKYDVMILPTTPIPASLIEGEDALERARLLTRLTAPFNLTGLPALSLPCGFTKDSLPIGLQIVSRAWNEAGIIQAGHAYEQSTEWHQRKPDLSAF